MRSYTELMAIRSFEERFRYLKEFSQLGVATFGHNRWINQEFYRSERWKRVRRQVLIRDNGYDLAHPEYGIAIDPIVHHMNPATLEQFLSDDPDLYNPEYLITTSKRTHNAIHFGDEHLLPQLPTVRRPYDTCPWR